MKSTNITLKVTVREAWLLSEATKLLLKQDRDERVYERIAELAKLADDMYDFWGENSHLDYGLRGDIPERQDGRVYRTVLTPTTEKTT